ncbi:C4-dicarboxylate ABC transporter [Jannaschia sp. EhC01]|nr:C4-dicarboxylate ABC transporter [Jannaschia sp. EhC01]
MLAAAILSLTAVVWFASYRYFQSEELQRAGGRLSLYRSTVLAEVERFEHLTHVLSVDPYVIAALEDGANDLLNTRLMDFAQAAGLDAIFLMDVDGLTTAASNADTEGTFVGQTYAFRPYFQAALDGETGRFYGIGATTGLPGYFIADPVRDAGGRVIGVVAIKINLLPFEASWRDAGEEVMLADAQGVVLLASDPAWRYRTLAPLTEADRHLIQQARQFTGQPLDLLDWNVSGDRATILGAERLHVATEDLPFGWQLHYLASDEAMVTRASLAAGAVLVLAALGLIVAQLQRARRLGAALRRSEAEEADLRQANERLATEIEDRRRAERRLRETKEELERASRLAALGQLAASVTHELGQPIAAMRNHLTAHEITHHGDTRLTRFMGDLVDRMEGITRQLKFFARSDTEPFEQVDLRECVAAVVALVRPSADVADVEIDYVAPAYPVLARGSRLRLEQVLTNLFRNGIDAMEDAQDRRLTVRLGVEDGGVWVDVADLGHGLGEASLAQLSEPFYTTRESGQGMGLGLAISTGILADHGGHLDARDGVAGGTVFRIVLPLGTQQDVAAQ